MEKAQHGYKLKEPSLNVLGLLFNSREEGVEFLTEGIYQQ